jgi:hypothetical protein
VGIQNLCQIHHNSTLQIFNLHANIGQNNAFYSIIAMKMQHCTRHIIIQNIIINFAMNPPLGISPECDAEQASFYLGFRGQALGAYKLGGWGGGNLGHLREGGSFPTELVTSYINYV